MVIFLYILAIICTEAVVEIVVKSVFFDKVKSKFKLFEIPFIKELTSCGHCFSVWAALLFTLIIFLFGNTGIVGIPKVVQIFIIWLFVQRMSNYLHMFIDKYVDKFYK